MVPEIKDFLYEERLKEKELPILQDRRERGDLIMMYKIDRQDLVSLMEDGDRRT
ncbi:hypothetical protein E2C01_019435 [Portunus trituberculatus]|uniref:Uncharacterized protein n=1 Tax=Portunus trituberculatus TaxID=210409 RepID=A0A5B7DXL2_PORTR|nr:hypothetical protein [Portunus trituberculatus]